MKWAKENQTISEVLDDWRLVPRILTAGYGIVCWQVVSWFMGIDDPTGAQATFVSTVIGAAAAWFGLYVNSGKRSKGSGE